MIQNRDRFLNFLISPYNHDDRNDDNDDNANNVICCCCCLFVCFVLF